MFLISSDVLIKKSSNMTKYKLGILNSDGMDCTYGGVAPFLRNMHEDLSKAFDVEYFIIPDRLKRLPGPGRLKMVLTLWHRRKDLRKCDFLLSHVPEGSWISAMLGLPYAHIYHGNYNPMTQSRYWYGKYFKWVFDLMGKRIEKTAKIKYTVGPVWGDKKKLFNPICHNIKPVPYSDRKGFIFAGRLEDIKNIDRLIRIYSRLPEQVREEDHFYIAGDGTKRNYLESVVGKTGGQKFVHLLGSLPNEELVRTDSKKRILIMASSQEGFPTAIAEALSVGVPVISTDVGDISSIIKNNENGLLLPLDFKDEDYVSAIMTIMNDYERFAVAALDSSRVFDRHKITESVILDIKGVLGDMKI